MNDMKGEIVSKLDDLKKYAKLLKEYGSHAKAELKKDPMLRGAVERYMQLSIEIVIEAGEMIISSEGMRKPDTYRDVILILGEGGVLTKRFAAKLAPAAGFRNILIHRYGEVNLDELYAHMKGDLRDFDEFARQVSAYLNRK